MVLSNNLKLNLTDDSDDITRFKDWRQALTDNSESSNMVKIDKAYKELGDKIDASAVSYNVVYYGVDNTGVNDASGKVQEIVDNMGEQGGTLFFPNGTYLFAHPVTVGSDVKLQGDANTIFKTDDNAHSEFLRIGSTNNPSGYNGFSNVEIYGIIFDLGGVWSISGTTLTYKAKYSKDNRDFNGYYSFCPIRAAHGSGLTIRNCVFKNGIYGGYTGSAGTNPHVLDLGGIKNLLIESCTFDTMFATANRISNVYGGSDKDSAQPDVDYTDYIQLDAIYGDGSKVDIQGQMDGTICRDVIIRDNRFNGMPEWTTVINNTGDGDATMSGVSEEDKQYRFAFHAAIGTCHDTSHPQYQPQNVEIYHNCFSGTWSSHYDSLQKEPARKFCHGAIYAYPGARGYNIHDNTFVEQKSYANNRSTAAFLYGSLAGIVHDNVFINYGMPLPVGEKKYTMDPIKFETMDEWQSNKTGFFDGLKYCKSSNNLWIRDGQSPTVLNSPELNIKPTIRLQADNTGNTDATLDIHRALQSLKTSGGTLIIPSGTYKIGTYIGDKDDRAPAQEYLWIYSNTRIVGEGTAVLKTGSGGSSVSPKSLLRNYTNKDTGGYDCAQNICIENIVFDRDGMDSGPTVGFCHAQNITIKNCTWRNLNSPTNSSHCLELVGCKNVYIEHCRFEKGYTGGINSELLNIDGTTNGAFGGETYVKYDNTPCMNIEISNCVFESCKASEVTDGGRFLSPAIGNHYNSSSGYTTHDGIHIHHCSFLGDWSKQTSNRRDTINFGDGVKNVLIHDNNFIGATYQYSKGVNFAFHSAAQETDIANMATCYIFNNHFVNVEAKSVLNDAIKQRVHAYNNSVLENGVVQVYGNSLGTWQVETMSQTAVSPGEATIAPKFLWGGNIKTGETNTCDVKNITAYTALLILCEKGWMICWRNGTEIQGGSAFGDLNSGSGEARVRTLTFYATLSGTNLTLKQCNALIHNPGSTHSGDTYEQAVTAIYGWF